MKTPIYVGYDTREHPAWLVCEESLLLHDVNERIEVIPLTHRQLRRDKLFKRTWHMEASGQMIDESDGRPFSTEFSHSRFLVPMLAHLDGHKGYAVFVDCDFMFFDDISKMLEKVDHTKAVSVVKFRLPIPEGVKMDGVVQQGYKRKLWSSLMVFNMSHPGIDRFLMQDINTVDGRAMHNFYGMPDSEIGEIDPEWNYVPGLSDYLLFGPKAVHWSLGGPWMKDYRNTEFAAPWITCFENIASGDISHGEAYPHNLFPLV